MPHYDWSKNQGAYFDAIYAGDTCSFNARELGVDLLTRVTVNARGSIFRNAGRLTRQWRIAALIRHTSVLEVGE